MVGVFVMAAHGRLIYKIIPTTEATVLIHSAKAKEDQKKEKKRKEPE